MQCNLFLYIKIQILYMHLFLISTTVINQIIQIANIINKFRNFKTCYNFFYYTNRSVLFKLEYVILYFIF